MIKTPDHHFTAYMKPEVEARVASDLEFIVTAVLDHMKDQLEAIVLVGGFGRGEGTVVTESGQFRPLNDYDLVLVTRSGGRPAHDLNALGRSLAVRLNIDFVDLGVIPQRALPHMKPTMFNFDLKYGGCVLWGSPDVLSAVPTFAPEQIPVFEATRLLFNRGGGLLWGLLRTESETKSDVFRGNQLKKAALAIGDAELVLRGQYHVSYLERANRLRHLHGVDSHLVQAYMEAVRERQVLTGPMQLSYADFSDRYRHFIGLYEQVYRDTETRRLGAFVTDWTAYRNQFRPQPEGTVNRLKRLIRDARLGSPGSFRFAAQDLLMIALPILLFEPQNEDQLQVAKRMLGTGSAEWHSLVEAFVTRWHEGVWK